MAQIISGGGATFDYLLYGEQNPGIVSYLQNMQGAAVNNLGATAQMFNAKLVETVDRMYNGEAMRLARAAVRKVATMWNADEIYLLDTIALLQNAPPKMIPYIMAEPSIRKLYHQQRIEGYGDYYIDSQPDQCGEGHTDYEAVMDGVFTPSETDSDAYVSTSYLHLEETEMLRLDQQDDVMLTWEQVKIMMAKGNEDPTSRFNATLG